MMLTSSSEALYLLLAGARDTSGPLGGLRGLEAGSVPRRTSMYLSPFHLEGTSLESQL